MGDFEDLLLKLKNKFEQNKREYYPYIEHIRFPKYKILERNSKIEFKFPITLLVGENGANKTSFIWFSRGEDCGTLLVLNSGR